MEPVSTQCSPTEPLVETIPRSDNAEINRLTLELLVPKTKYKRYLATHDPKLYEKTREKEQQYLRHKKEIQMLTQQLLEQNGNKNKSNTKCGTLPSAHAEMAISKRIQELFDAYVDACISHFENLHQMKEPQNDWEEHAEERETEQEETMFANCDAPHHPAKTPEPQRTKSTVPFYGMNMFMKKGR